MKFFRPILSITLAALVLFTATSFSVGLHFCSGDLQNVALFTKAAACEKEKSLPPCHQEQPQPCCEDTFVTHNAEQTLQTLTIQQDAAPSLLADLTVSEVMLADVIPPVAAADVKYVDSGPPLPPADLTIIHQIFRI